VAEETRESRKAILRAAREGFAARGFYGTSMEYITRNAGVSKGAVYWYFPGKWEVYKAVVAEEAEKLKEIVLPPGLEFPTGEAMDFFLTRGERLIDLFAEDPVCRLLFIHLQLEAMRGREEMIELVTALRASITDDVISVIEAVFPGDSLSRLGISHRDLVNMFVGILNGIILNIELTITREEAGRNWRFLIQSVLGGISNEP
jgi:AcrR family transcriptional regulator